MNADEIAEGKKTYPYTLLEYLEKCPIGQRFTHCIDCTFTSQLGACYHPIDIQTEITAGRARPEINEYDVPERAADFALREKNRIKILQDRAFGQVDRR